MLSSIHRQTARLALLSSIVRLVSANSQSSSFAVVLPAIAYPVAFDDCYAFLQLLGILVCVLATNVDFDWDLSAFQWFEE